MKITTIRNPRDESIILDETLIGHVEKAAGKWNAITADWHVVCATRDEAIEALLAIHLEAA